MTKYLELAKLHFESAINALKERDYADAETELLRALNLAPDRPSILTNLSAVLIAQNKWADASKISARLLEIEPGNIEGLINLGICEGNTGNLDQALNYFSEALKINPNFTAAWINKGNILLEKEVFSEAKECFLNALRLEEKSEEAHIGLGNLHNELCDYRLGLKHLSIALEINPDNHQAQWNKALSLLRLGEYKEGWRLYESRWNIYGMSEHKRYQDIPPWIGGGSLNGKTILVYAEQGFGDTIQMSRYIPLLINRLGAKVIFEVPSSLVELMHSLDSKVQVINSQIELTQAQKAYIDFQCPIMSLPLAFGTNIETIPTQAPYLDAALHKRQFWLKKLSEASIIKQPFRVGISWSGSGHYAGKKSFRRDIPFNMVRAIAHDLSIHGIEIHAIQKEITGDCLDNNPHNFFLHHNFLNSFADTAALIMELDLIVSIDTATGHLSGALGKKTFLAIPNPPDFMAMTDLNHSLWYPNTTLIRQDQRSVWPIDKIKDAILHAKHNSNN